MCLYCVVTLQKEDFPLADKLVESCSAGSITLAIERTLFIKNRSTLYIFENAQGCGCSLLSEEWNPETHEFRPEVLPSLANVLQKIRHQTSTGFTFYACWSGDKIKEELQTSIEGLTELVLQNKVGLYSKYLIA